MAIYGGFSPSTLGMLAQGYSLKVIGGNVANINTGGYKETEVRFRTVLSDSITNQSDLAGVRTTTLQHVAQQGQILASDRELDIAISGQGMFVINSETSGSGDEYYTRDGSLIMKLDAAGSTNAYLANKTGHYVMGWAAGTDGTFSTTGALSAIQIDPALFTQTGAATTNVTLNLNLPAVSSPGDQHDYRVQVYDSNFAAQDVTLRFTRATANNTWDVQTIYQGTPTAQVDTITLGGTVETGDIYRVTVNGTTVSYTTQATDTTLDNIAAGLVAAINANGTVSPVITAAVGTGGTLTLTADTAGTSFTASASATNGGATNDNTASQATTTANNNGTITSAAQQLTFNSKGKINNTSPLNYSFTFSGGSTATIDFDFLNTTQYAANFTMLYVQKDGQGKANLRNIEFDQSGHVVGHFSDNTQRKLYKLALATFINPDGLKSHDGNIFSATGDSGDVTYREAGSNGFATFAPNAFEISNVELSEEFTRMIMVQNAYNSSATVFRTVDEMLTAARDLKR